MPLLSEVKYETKIRELKDVSPKSILAMLRDVRVNIGKLECTFANVDLARVLQVVESGEYELEGDVSTRINLSSARRVINAYKEHSEGGCQSCVSLERETIDAQDATSGWYCRVSDPDYNANPRGDGPGVRYEGFSQKVKKHYHTPCDSWKPKFSPKLEVLIGEE